MSERSYTLVTDSTCDLTAEFLSEINVPAIPLGFTIDGKVYKDFDPDMPLERFYSLLRQGLRATTSQITVSQYIEGFTPYLEKGDVIYLAFSSGLSGSYSSACVAAKELSERFPDRTLYIIDTHAASLGEGLLVWRAAMKRDEGLSIHELKDWVEKNWQTFCHLVTVDDLKALRAGGRISAASEIIGTFFDIKPMIYLNLEGKLIPDGKVRGRKRALNRLIAQAKEDIVNPREQILTLCQGDCIEDAEYVRKRLIEEVGVIDVRIGYAGPVIGAHTGPGVIAIFFTGNNRR